MFHYSAKNLTQEQAYKFLSGSIIPRPIAWVTTYNSDETVLNAAPFSFFNAAAAKLPLVTLAILRENDLPKDTAKNLLASKELVIQLINDALVEKMNQTAASLDSSQSEVLANELATVPSQTVRVPGIKDAPVRLEGRLHQYVPINDHQGRIISDLFIIEITDFYFHPTVFDPEKAHILPNTLQPIARLAGQTYAHLDHFFDLPRPT